MQSRYYNADWGRFVNADDTTVVQLAQGELLEANLFAYCVNNPINMIDEDGFKAIFIGVMKLGPSLIKGAKIAIAVSKKAGSKLVNIAKGLFSKAIKLPNTLFTSSKLQHEFKHAGDFGVTGNWNNANAKLYQRAIQNHINTAKNVYKSTYRGQNVNVYINKNTGVGAYTDLSGNYIGGWKFTPDQIKFHLTNGTKIK